MRLVHLSDLHLGFRAFRRTDRGWNLRERDVAGAFRHAIQEIGELGPDLVLITGDLFDRPDPPSTALLTLFRGMDSLRRRLPGVPILVIAGERDSPGNPADPGPVAALDALPGVEAAAGAARAVRFRRAGVHALLVPHGAVLRPPFPELRPDPKAKWNLLLIRGEVSRESGSVPVDPSEWDYVALGGSHLTDNPLPGVWVAGSLERVGWDPWAEATEEKGFLVYDLERGEGELHPVPSRPVVDLAPVRTSPSDSEAGTRRLRDVLKGVPGGIQGRILRVRLRGDILSPEEGAAPGLLAAVRGRTAHVEFVMLGDGETGGQEVEAASDRVAGAPNAPESPFSFLPDSGLVAVVGRDPRLRRRGARELGRALPEGPPVGNEGLLVGLAWAGAPGEPERLLREGASLLAGSGASAPPESPPGEGEDAVSVEPKTQGRTPAPEGAPPGDEEMAALEEELAGLRADAMEAAGEMEAGNLEWARNRQDAESRLMAYRDRARELRARFREMERDGPDYLCPTCGRTVGEGHEDLLRTLREEWEAVVQDGRWWKRRRDQMEEKPEELRRLEGVALKYHAHLESVAEAVEVARERRRWEARTGAPEPSRSRPEAGWSEAPGIRPILRRLLRRAGNFMAVLTDGLVSGVLWSEGTLRVRDADGELRPPVEEESAPLSFCVHLALWLEVRALGRAPHGVVFGEYAGGGGLEEPTVRSMAIASRVLGSEVPVVFVVSPDVVERLPEVPDLLVEVTEKGGDLAWSERPAGRPRIRFLRTS
jgi:DNA repair protein SbcD/Mre11